MVEKGFTLVDAMVSVAVVGILAAIAMPAYHTRIAKAQSSEAIAMMDAEKEQYGLAGASFATQGKAGKAKTGSVNITNLGGGISK